jgi:hypothetical protein
VQNLSARSSPGTHGRTRQQRVIARAGTTHERSDQRRPGTLLAVLVAIGLLAAGCGGGDSPSHGAAASTPFVVARVAYAGVQHLRYRYGPIAIHPGQNPIEFRPPTQKPKVAGSITRFRLDLAYVDGTKPRWTSCTCTTACGSCAAKRRSRRGRRRRSRSFRAASATAMTPAIRGS